MKKRAKEKHFNFPYLYDGDNEIVAKAYGPVATPHAFVFDQNRKLRYQGRIDDVEKPTKTPNHLDTRVAIEALLENKPVPVTTTKVFGCSIKWQEKSDWMTKTAKQWAAEPVKLEMVDVAGIKNLVKNSSEKLRLINLWATWCGPCRAEMPSMERLYQAYRDRGFRVAAVSVDEGGDDAVLAFGRQLGLTFDLLHDQSGNIQMAYQTDGLPQSILIDRDGRVDYMAMGAVEWDSPAMRQRVEQLLNSAN